MAIKMTFKNKRFQKAYDAICTQNPDIFNLDNYVTLDDLYFDLIDKYEKFYKISKPDSTTKTARYFAGLVLNNIQQQFCDEFAKKFTINYAIREYKRQARENKFDLEGVAYGKIADWLVELKELRKLVKESNEF